MGYCRIFQKIEPPLREKSKVDPYHLFGFELPRIFTWFTTASFGDKRSPRENEDNSQQPERLLTILWQPGLGITAEKDGNRKSDREKVVLEQLFLKNQIRNQLRHSVSAGNAEERKIPPAWVTAGFFKR